MLVGTAVPTVRSACSCPDHGFPSPCPQHDSSPQARIALVNTALTAAGMWLLAIPGIGLLSLFVFICSFIPIAGCIISTVPIGFVALTGAPPCTTHQQPSLCGAATRDTCPCTPAPPTHPIMQSTASSSSSWSSSW